LRGFKVGITDRRDLTEYGVEMASCGVIYIPSFVKTDVSVQAILFAPEI
jgi:hypothetical protein